MYLSTCTRWDIDYSVMPLTRAMTNLKGKHMVPAKRVLRYLEGTPDLCVRYSKKQPVVALSSCESEYIALASASQEAVYLSDLLSELTFPQFSSVQMYETTWELFSYHVLQYSRQGPNTLVRWYHCLRELVASNKIIVSRVKTTDQLADIFTKCLDYLNIRAILDKIINCAS